MYNACTRALTYYTRGRTSVQTQFWRTLTLNPYAQRAAERRTARKCRPERPCSVDGREPSGRRADARDERLWPTIKIRWFTDVADRDSTRYFSGIFCRHNHGNALNASAVVIIINVCWPYSMRWCLSFFSIFFFFVCGTVLRASQSCARGGSVFGARNQGVSEHRIYHTRTNTDGRIARVGEGGGL